MLGTAQERTPSVSDEVETTIVMFRAAVAHLDHQAASRTGQADPKAARSWYNPVDDVLSTSTVCVADGIASLSHGDLVFVVVEGAMRVRLRRSAPPAVKS